MKRRAARPLALASLVAIAPVALSCTNRDAQRNAAPTSAVVVGTTNGSTAGSTTPSTTTSSTTILTAPTSDVRPGEVPGAEGDSPTTPPPSTPPTTMPTSAPPSSVPMPPASDSPSVPVSPDLGAGPAPDPAFDPADPNTWMTGGCRFVTPDEIAGALGVEVVSVEPHSAATPAPVFWCDYATVGGWVRVEWAQDERAGTFGVEEASLAQHDAQLVDGLGTRAYFEPHGSATGLIWVRTMAGRLEVESFADSPQPDTRGALVALAAAGLSRL